MQLPDIKQAQKERLSHIDFRVCYLGTIGRGDLISRFGIKPAAATRDITLYSELAPKNLTYDTKAKAYVRSENFKPLFEYSLPQVFAALSQGFGKNIVVGNQPMISCEIPARLINPRLSVLSFVTRAIHQKKFIKMQYRSNTSGLTDKEILPFALVDTGLRWHVRAYDRTEGKERFADFVLTRIDSPELVTTEILPHEVPDLDGQWNRMIELEMVPHPSRSYPETIAMDYDMKDGVLRASVRAAVVGYFLRRWNVDCSANHSLKGDEYHLWLRNGNQLKEAGNAVIAPGFKE